MKKILYTIMALAISAFTLQSCEDVPSPYDIPGVSGGSGDDTPTVSGDGTVDNPYNVAAANAACKELEQSSTSASYYSDPVYVKGKVSQIADTEFNSTYGNITFYISDTGETTSQLEAYRCLGLGGAKFKSLEDIKVGDEVIIYGKLQNWLGTYEFTSGCQLYSLNGETAGGSSSSAEAKGTGTQADPYNVAGVVAYINTLGADTESPNEVWVKGKVESNSTTDATISSYGNMTFTMIDEGYSTTFTAFQVYGPGKNKFTSVSSIKAGDEVVVCGKVVNYKGNTPETVSKGAAYVYSINGKTEEGGGSDTPSGTAKGTGTEADPFNVAGIIAYTSALAADVNSTSEVYFTGTVASFKSGEEPGNSYGNATFYITDDSSSDKFYCFRVLGPGNTKFTSADQLKVGQKVTVCGNVVNYKGNTPETVSGKAYVVKVEGDGSSSGGGSTSGNTLTFANMGYSNAQELDGTAISIGDATVTFSKGSGTVTPKYYTSGTAVRLYGGGTITVSSSKTIASITFTYADNTSTATYCPKGDATVSAGSYSDDSKTWTLNATSGTMTRAVGTGQWRITSMTINYASGAKRYIRRR